MIVSKRELSRIYGISAHYIDQAIDRGAPVASRGATRKEGFKIDTAEWLTWSVADAIAGIDPVRVAQTELMQANAELKQRKLSELEAITLTTPQIVELYSAESDVVRKFIGEVAARCAPQIATESNPSIVEDIIADEINVALGRISKHD